MLPLRLFRDRRFSISNSTGFLLHFAMFGNFVMAIQFLVGGAGDERPDGRRVDAAVDGHAVPRLAASRAASGSAPDPAIPAADRHGCSLGSARSSWR